MCEKFILLHLFISSFLLTGANVLHHALSVKFSSVLIFSSPFVVIFSV